MSNKILNLDLSKDPIMPAIVYGRVGDDRLQTVTVNLSRRDEVADLTGYKITFEGTTYNGKTKVFDSENVSTTAAGLKKGTFDYTFPNMAFAVAGKYEQAYFSIVKDGKRDSTAGFEIYVDGNADIDAPEAETIITEYNKLVAELNELQKQAITELNNQQNQAINEMNQNFTAAQERIVELDIQISALRDQIEQALTDFESGNFWTKEESFNKEESSANVIYQVIGKEEVLMTITLDLKNKLAGSNVENPNSVGFKSQADLANPNDFPADRYINYPSLYALDGVSNVTSNAQNKDFCNQLCFKYNVLEIVKRELGEEFFIGRGVTTLEDEIKLVTSLITQFNLNFWAKGSGVYNGSIRNWLGAKIWFDDTRWTTATRTNETNEIKKISINNDPINKIGRYFNSQGYIQGLIYADPSDGTTPTSVHADYSNLEISLKLSVNEHIKALIAQYSGKNFEPATPEEIIVGERDDVVVTPKGLKAATESTTPFVEYFGLAPAVTTLSGEYTDIPFPPSIAVPSNGIDRRPYKINDNGSLTITRDCKLEITLNAKFVAGATSPTTYAYLYVNKPASDSTRLLTWGSTRATNGTLNFDWTNQGSKTLAFKTGDTISPSFRVAPNAQITNFQFLGGKIEEVLPDNGPAVNLRSTTNNPQEQPTKLKAYFDAGDYPRNITETPYFVPFGPILKDNNDELSSPAYVRNSNGSVSFLRDMTIMITVNCKLLVGDTNPTDYVYIVVIVNDDPMPDTIISQGSTAATNGTMRLNWNQMGNYILSVKAGDFLGISVNGIRSGKTLSGVQITTAVIEEI